MPSIINRAGVVGNFGEETGGDLPEPTETPVETKFAKKEADEDTDNTDAVDKPND